MSLIYLPLSFVYRQQGQTKRKLVSGPAAAGCVKKKKKGGGGGGGGDWELFFSFCKIFLLKKMDNIFVTKPKKKF